MAGTDRVIVVATGKTGPSGGGGGSSLSFNGSDMTMSTSTWGVTSLGVPYYDAAGVVDTDRAFVQFDLTTDLPVLIRIGA